MTNPIRDPARAEVIRALREQTNGHGLPVGAPPVLEGGKQIVTFNPMQSVFVITDSILPGQPMPMVVEGQMMPGKMIDWTAFGETLREAVVGKFGALVSDWPAGAVHEVNAVNAVAEFQRKAMALQEAARGLRDKELEAVTEMPEPPEESRPPLGLCEPPDAPGFDANGSEVP